MRWDERTQTIGVAGLNLLYVLHFTLYTKDNDPKTPNQVAKYIEFCGRPHRLIDSVGIEIIPPLS